MGTIVKRNQPCLSETCESSNARQVYENGSSHCFSCGKSFKSKSPSNKSKTDAPSIKTNFEKFLKLETLEEIDSYRSAPLTSRGIEKSVTDFYDVRVSYDINGKVESQFFGYDSGKTWQRKWIQAKEKKDAFKWIGPKTDRLFGMERFARGGKRIILCEGALDALSVQVANFKKYKRMYPVVSSHSASAIKTLENREYLRSFDEVIICYDEDDAGKKATEKAVKEIGYDKVKVVNLPRADANDVLQKDGWEELLRCMFNAESRTPSGIINREDIWSSVISFNEKESIPYPACVDSLNTKLKGRRGGEITLFISGTGSGKTTLIREILEDAIVNRGEKFGILSLEESPAETARNLSAMYLKKNPSEELIAIEELKKGFDAVFGEEGSEERLIVLDHQGSLKDDQAIDQMEYMCLKGVSGLLIDHITILTSEGVDNLYGNEAHDKMMNNLLRLAKRYPSVWIGLVSHLRKAPLGGKSFEEGRLPSIDDIKGSGSIKQVSFDIVAFARNMTHEDEDVRNSIKCSVLKSRFTGLTGPVPGFHYDNSTGRLTQGLFIDPEKETESDKKFSKLKPLKPPFLKPSKHTA